MRPRNQAMQRLLASLANPWFWAAATFSVRLFFLCLIPTHPGLFLDPGAPVLAPAPAVESFGGAVALLQRRTDSHPFTVDEHCYEEMARNIVLGRGFVIDSPFMVNTPGQPTMFAGAAYPAFLAGVYAVAGNGNQLAAFLIQSLLQAFAAVWVFRAGARLGGALAGGCGAAFLCFHPVVIWVSLSIMSEAILIPGVAWLCWRCVTMDDAGARVSPWWLGVVSAVLCLTRSTALGFALVAWATVVWHRREGAGAGEGQIEGAHKQGGSNRWNSPMAASVVFWVAFALCCAPWTIRNYAHWHRFIPFSTKSGAGAWIFNHPGLVVEWSSRSFEGPQPVDIHAPAIRSLPDEAARDARLMEMFHEFVRTDPMRFLGLCWIRFWMAVLPVSVSAHHFAARVSAWYAKGPVLVLGGLAVVICGVRRRDGRWRMLGPAWPILGMVCYWQLIQTLAGPGLRFRLPVEPAWAVLIGVLISVLAGGWNPLARARR